MNGHVDQDGRALIAISLQTSDTGIPHEILAWIDTGFNGDLVLPQHAIDGLGLSLREQSRRFLLTGRRSP